MKEKLLLTEFLERKKMPNVYICNIYIYIYIYILIKENKPNHTQIPIWFGSLIKSKLVSQYIFLGMCFKSLYFVILGFVFCSFKSMKSFFKIFDFCSSSLTLLVIELHIEKMKITYFQKLLKD